MGPHEPDGQRWRWPLARYLAATRPAFLTVTLLSVLLGLLSARADGWPLEIAPATLTLLFALVAHAGANVINDYYDARNGSDACNVTRLYPFTGGSRFIQNGVLTCRQTAIFGYALLAAVIPPGLWLTWHAGGGLAVIGLAGLTLAWAYSAPPLRLMTRGLGEAAIVAGWLAVIVGSDYVVRGGFALAPLQRGLSLALLLSAILFLNQFPDAPADAAAGKRTLVVRLGSARARLLYPVLCGAAYLALARAITTGALPAPAWLAMGTLPLSAAAALGTWRHAGTPAALHSAIRQTIAAANLHGITLALALLVA